MTDRPIIFSSPMIVALLEGRKTQTRRLASSPLVKCQPSDRLYVRESAMIAPAGWTTSPVNPMGPNCREVGYVAEHGGEMTEAARDYSLKITPSIHMPRWASRLTLVVAEVRRQRLHDISRDDAIAEGLYLTSANIEEFFRWPAPFDDGHWLSPVAAYRWLWERLHGADSWATNPEVVALTFAVHRCNIDHMPARAAA